MSPLRAVLAFLLLSTSAAMVVFSAVLAAACWYGCHPWWHSLLYLLASSYAAALKFIMEKVLG